MIIIMKAKKLISRLKHPECVIFSERRHTDKSLVAEQEIKN